MEKQTFKKINPFYLLLTTLIVFRLITILLVNKVPCMDPTYYELGLQIFNGNLIIEPDEKNYASPLGYGFFYFILKEYIFFDFKKTSHFIYLTSSIIAFVGLSKYCSLLFDKKSSFIISLLFIVFPFLSIAPVGYSHTGIFGLSILIWIFFFIEKINKKKNFFDSVVYFVLLFALSQIRFELFFFLIIYIIFNSIINKNLGKLFYIIFLLVIFINYIINQAIILDLEYAQFGGDKRWAYKVWTHTLSFRFLGYYDPIFSFEKSNEIFGNAIKNNYSIISAILNNKTEFIKNILFNVKNIFIYISYPLSIPLFNFPLLGVIFNNNSSLEQKKKIYKIISIVIIYLITPLFFHAEIRYMGASSMFILILLGLSLAKLTNKVTIIFILLNLIVSLIYIFQYSIMNSLCS
jgi:hypothetical protein